MTYEDILKDVITRIIKPNNNIDILDLTVESCETWDSLAHMKLIIELENQFGITFSEIEIERATSFCSLLRIIENK